MRRLLLANRAPQRAPAARTFIVNLFVLVEALYLFNCRSRNRLSSPDGLFGNRLAPCGVFAMLGAQLLLNLTR